MLKRAIEFVYLAGINLALSFNFSDGRDRVHPRPKSVIAMHRCLIIRRKSPLLVLLWQVGRKPSFHRIDPWYIQLT